MGLVTNIVDFTPGTPIFASEVNGNFDNIVQVVNGGLDDHNVAGFTAAVIVAGEFDLDRIPVLSVDKIPQLPGNRVDTAWGDVSGKPVQATRWPTWAEVSGKPSSFPPSSHTHPWADVTGKPAQATRWPTWGEVTGKPSSFTPSSHTHPWADVTGKPAQATRWPTWSEVSDKPSSFTPSSHTHSLSSGSITDTLPVSKGGTGQTSLTSGSYLRGNGTSAVSLRTPSQVRSDIGAAASSHTHSGADITSGTVPYARLPVGAGSSNVAPGQANVSYPPVGSVRLVFVSGMTSGVLLGVTFSGSVSTVDSYLRDDGMLEWNPGTELFGTWTALSTSGQGNNGHVVLAVRTA